MLGQLVPCGGGPPVPLVKVKLLVGRLDSCDIPIRCGTVSPRHCELEQRDGFWFVRDLVSGNGTRVNGTRCTTQWLLPRDVLTVAKHRYQVMYRPPPNRPPPPRIESAESTIRPAPPAVATPAPKSPTGVSPDDTGDWDTGVWFELGELIPCGGGTAIPLNKPKLLVGRDRGCDVTLRVGTVSARHCELEWTEGAWVVRDLGSRNGIRVNGERCESKRLMPGSILTIGTERYRVAYTPPGGQPASPTKGPVFAQSLLEAAGLGRWDPGQAPQAGDDPTRKRFTLDD